MGMSVEASNRTQKREKNIQHSVGKQISQKAPQATAEQMRLAQLVSDAKDDDAQMSRSVAQIIEITGVNEEDALLALYDSSNDSSRAIELILERRSLGQDAGWEKAGRRKNRGGTNVTENTEDDSKDDRTKDNRWERGESRGRGRGRRDKGRDQDRGRGNDDNDKENEDSHDRSRGKRGRGRGRSGTSWGRGGGRSKGRGAPRHLNRNLGVGGGKPSTGFGSFNDDSPTEPVELWKESECWDIEVGTWSSEDAQKQKAEQSTTETYSEKWGTESWNESLSESRVFQAQNVSSMSDNRVGQHISEKPPGEKFSDAPPQMGERIDLGTLFKKPGDQSQPARSDITSKYGPQPTQPHTASDVIQQLQHQGQSNSLFSENGSTATSRLFSGYDNRSQQNSQAVTQSLFDSTKSQSAYSQFNGKMGQHDATQSPSSSSFLASFSGIKTSGSHQQHQQPGVLGQLGDLSSKQSSLSPYQREPSVENPDMGSFSQGQQQRATDAVKASLGMPIGDGSAIGALPPGLRQENAGMDERRSPLTGPNIHGINKDDPQLSFGSPLPPQANTQNRQQRRKMPALTSRIPASAVEMPGSNAYNSKEYVNFSLQFGVDDSTSPTSLEASLTSDYGTVIQQNGPGGVMGQQSSLFLNNDVPATDATGNHLSSATASLFGQQPTKAPGMDAGLTSDDSRRSSQGVNESAMSSSAMDQAKRPPPGLSMPTVASSTLSSLSASGNSSYLGGGRVGHDLGSSYSASAERIPGTHPLDGSLNQTSSSSFPQVRSYYSSSPVANQKQNQQMRREHAGSTGHDLHSPVSSPSLPSSLQSSPMPSNNMIHVATTSKDQTSSVAAAPSSLSNMSSLATSLSQVSISSAPMQQHGRDMVQSSMATTSTMSAYPSSSSAGAATAVSMGLGYGSSQDSVSTYSSHTPSAGYNNTMQPDHNRQSADSSSVTASASTAVSSATFGGQSTSTPSGGLGGFASNKQPSSHPVSNKAAANAPPGVTAGPILQGQYGIPMAGLMPYSPDMAYGYDQLLLAQSRVINPLNYYDMHFHNNTQSASMNSRDSATGIGQPSAGQGKYNRGDPSSPTTPSLPGSMGSGLSQHSSSVSQQNAHLKGSQTAAHHTAHQQYVGAMPAYAAGYGSLAAPPYYGLGMANTASFQYPPTMFAAMHQAPKHSVNTSTGFQQPNAAFSHSHSTATSSSGGMPDIQGSNYTKAHASAFEKQQGYHQHTNTPPPFNLQALTAAVAGGGGGASAGAPGIGPYATAPYMTMLQPHQASQQQAIHLLQQQQHQDASVGSHRGLGSNNMAKGVSKPGGYGSSASTYWGN